MSSNLGETPRLPLVSQIPRSDSHELPRTFNYTQKKWLLGMSLAEVLRFSINDFRLNYASYIKNFPKLSFRLWGSDIRNSPSFISHQTAEPFQYRGGRFLFKVHRPGAIVEARRQAGKVRLRRLPEARGERVGDA